MKKSLCLSLAFTAISLVCGQFPGWINHTNTVAGGPAVRKGNILWCATAGGLEKWDLTAGTYRLFTHADDGIPGHRITDLCLDTGNNLWGIAGGGLFVIDKRNRCSYINRNISALRFVQYNSMPFHSLTADQSGNVWCLQGDTLNKIDASGGISKFITPYPSQYGNNDLVLHKSGNLWMSIIDFTGLILLEFNGSKWTKYTKGGVNGYQSKLCTDQKGNIWISAINTINSSQFIKFNSGSWTVYTDADFGFKSGGVGSVTTDDNDNLLMLAANGVMQYNGSKWKLHNWASMGIVDVQLQNHSDVVAEPNGKIRLLTENGAWHYDGSNWSALNPTRNYLLSNYIERMFEDGKGNKWVLCTNDKYLYVQRIVGKTWTVIDSLGSAGMIWDRYLSDAVQDTAGNLWISTQSGKLWKYSPAGIKTSAGTLGPVKLFAAKDGSIWFFTTPDSLFCLSGKSVKPISLKGSGFNSDTALGGIYVDGNQQIWLCGTTGWEKARVSKFDGSKWKILYPGTNLFEQQLKYTPQRVFFPDKNGRIWILNDYTRGYYENGTFYNKTYFTATDGYNSTRYALAEDSNGSIWLGGISHSTKYPVNGMGLYLEQFQTGTPYKYNLYNSGLVADTVISSILFSRDGSLWIGTHGSGISVLENALAVSTRQPAARNNQLFIYPNPCHDNIQIRLPQGFAARQLKISDLSGKVVMSLPFYNESLDVSHLTQGLYVIQVTGDQGTLSTKFLVQK